MQMWKDVKVFCDKSVSLLISYFLTDFVRNTASKMVPSLREGASGLTGGMADSIFARLKQVMLIIAQSSGSITIRISIIYC